MTTPIHITDGGGTKNKAKVSSIGQVVTAPFAYDETSFNILDVDSTAYNFYKPKAGKQFVITGIIAQGDQDITANTSPRVVVYESDGAASTTEDKVLLEFVVTRSQGFVFAPLNILVNEGKFINALTVDDDVHMTITGYYIPSLG